MFKKALAAGVFACSLAAAVVCAQETEPLSGLGLSAGIVSGSGFSYRNFPMKGWGYEVGTMFYVSSKTTFFDIGFQPMYVLHRNQSMAFYIAAGVSMYFHDDKEGDDNSTDVAVGAGIGSSYHVYDRIWGSFDFLLTAYQSEFLPYPQAAVHYML